MLPFKLLIGCFLRYMTQDRITIWLDRPLRKKLKEHVKKMRKTDPTSSASGLVRQLLRECLK